MSKLLVMDELWNEIKHIFPAPKPKPNGGSTSIDDRTCFTGLVFILKTRIPWEDFPQETGCTGMTLWNSLAQWSKFGLLNSIHLHLLNQMRKEDMIDISHVIVDLRYVVEQCIALFHQFRRLRNRYDKRADVHESFMSLACSVICARRLAPFF